MAQGSHAPLGDTTGLEISMKVPKKSRKCFTARCGHRNVFRDICPLFACWLECGCDCRVPCFLGTARQEKESLRLHHQPGMPTLGPFHKEGDKRHLVSVSEPNPFIRK